MTGVSAAEAIAAVVETATAAASATVAPTATSPSCLHRIGAD